MNSNFNSAIERIVKKYDPLKIILFGSRARNESEHDSDFDLFIVKENAYNKRQIAQDIYKSLLGLKIAIDIIIDTPENYDLFKENPYMIYKDIEREGKIIYERTGIF